MDGAILVLNAGSSSVKFALFTGVDLTSVYKGSIENILEKPLLTVVNAQRECLLKEAISSPGYKSALAYLLEWLEQLPIRFELKAIGHRVVHGGNLFHAPVLITDELFAQIASLSPLAPLHQPINCTLIESIGSLYPKLPQIACFDTSFHQTQEPLAKRFAIPQALNAEGVIRYGFHGISYEYIASVLPASIKEKKVIVAHLGNGASLCAMKNAQSMATSMGFTTLDGLVMGSRCGVLDPGVILYLLQEKNYLVEQVSHLLYQESGLLGVSGISSNMQELQSSKDPNALEAVDLFCYRAAMEICALFAVLDGCDAVIFTAGIGEKSAVVRKKISERLKWFGVVLDDELNRNNAAIISGPESSVLVGVIPTNEEYMIAKHTLSFVVSGCPL